MSYPDIQFPRKAQILFRPARYKVLYSGRGAAKSWSIARALILKAHTTPRGRDGLHFKVLCTREIQTSIKDSVHALLKNQIIKLGLGNHFKITDTSIVSRVTGAEFIFKGLRSNVVETVKSMEDVDICWVEEAQSVSKKSWDILGPTIRKPGSEIWVSFNPDDERDDTYQRFIVYPSDDVVAVKMYWYENPWFTAELEAERQSLWKKACANPEIFMDDYKHIWEGECKKFPDSVIFKGRYDILNFDWKEILASKGIEPQQQRWFHGNDFGFANDPNYMGRSFITGVGDEEELWVQDECFGYGIETDHLPNLFDGKVPNKRGIDTARTWPIKADCARPETISYLSRHGFDITGAEKWDGSIEDGIAHLKMFKKIHIHSENCPLAQDQARLYSYKVDKKVVDKDGNPQILPIVVDKFNDFWDQQRYALDGFIQRRGQDAIWAKLGQ
jgi:phage terminase large subunit